MKTINLPFRSDIPLRDQCSHGKPWTEDCIECEIVSLTDHLDRAEPQVKRDRARLNRLLEQRHKTTSADSAVPHIMAAIARAEKEQL